MVPQRLRFARHGVDCLVDLPGGLVEFRLDVVVIFHTQDRFDSVTGSHVEDVIGGSFDAADFVFQIPRGFAEILHTWVAALQTRAPTILDDVPDVEGHVSGDIDALDAARV